MAENEVSRDIESAPAEVLRIDFTGTVWFAAAVVAGGISIAVLAASGWRPGELGELAVVWWAGAIVAVLGTAAIGWAGCPVLGFPLPEADRQKSLSIRFGIVALLLGGVACAVVVLTTAA